MIHLCPVRVSNVTGVIKFVAFSVMITWTSAPFFTRLLARVAVLYAAMPPVTPSKTCLSFKFIKKPLSILIFSSILMFTISFFSESCKWMTSLWYEMLHNMKDKLILNAK